MLAVRSRFAKLEHNIKIKDLVVERKIIRPKKDWRNHYFQKVYNLATLGQYGCYTFKDIRISPISFGLYGTIVPRNVKSAVSNVLNNTIQEIISDNEEQRNNKLCRIDISFFGRLHAHKWNKLMKAVTLDIDDPKIFNDVRDRVSSFNIWLITQTSRGYHIILDLSQRDEAKQFYIAGGIWDKLVNDYRGILELQRDPQEPIPGTLYYKPKEKKRNFVKIIE